MARKIKKPVSRKRSQKNPPRNKRGEGADSGEKDKKRSKLGSERGASKSARSARDGSRKPLRKVDQNGDRLRRKPDKRGVRSPAKEVKPKKRKSLPKRPAPKKRKPLPKRPAPKRPAPKKRKPLPKRPEPKKRKPLPKRPAPKKRKPLPKRPAPKKRKPLPKRPEPKKRKPLPKRPAPKKREPLPKRPAPKKRKPLPKRPAPKKRKPLPKPPELKRPSRNLRVQEIITRKMEGVLSQALIRLRAEHSEFRYSINSHSNPDGSVDSELAIFNLSGDDWKKLFLPSETRSNVLLGDAITDFVDDFWLNTFILFGVEDWDDVTEIRELYENYRGMLDISTYYYPLNSSGVFRMIAAVDMILLGDPNVNEDEREGFIQKHGVNPKAVMIRLSWNPLNVNPVKF